MKRWILGGAAALMLSTSLTQPARADLNFDEFYEVMLGEGDITWESVLGQLAAYFGFAEVGIQDVLYNVNPAMLPPEVRMTYNKARYYWRSYRAEQVTGVGSLMTETMPAKKLELGALQIANASPTSIYYALQLGNEVNIISTQAKLEENQLAAQRAAQETDQRLQEEWVQQVETESAMERIGEYGTWNGAKKVAPTALALAY